MAVKRPATYADIEAAPERLVAEIIDGEFADLWPLDPPLGMNEDPTPCYAGDR